MNGADSGSAVRLAIAILLLWGAGLCWFVALEGQNFLAEGTSGSSYFTAILHEIARRAQTKEGTPK